VNRSLRWGGIRTQYVSRVNPAGKVSHFGLLFRNGVGRFAEGMGTRVDEVLLQSERFARLQKFFANISSRQSFKNRFDSVRVSLV